MELKRQQITEWQCHDTFCAGESNDGVRRNKFTQYLPAGPAWWTRLVIEVGYGYRADLLTRAMFADGAKQRIALGTTRQPIGHILNVASGDNRAVVKQQCCTHAKL